jgi:phage-related protein
MMFELLPQIQKTRKSINGLEVKPILSHYLFVCCHESRDQRCGYCGPIVLDALEDTIKKRAERTSDEERYILLFLLIN